MFIVVCLSEIVHIYKTLLCCKNKEKIEVQAGRNGFLKEVLQKPFYFQHQMVEWFLSLEEWYSVLLKLGLYFFIPPLAWAYGMVPT